MSRFENITEEWYWFPTLDRGYPIAYRDGHSSVNVDIVNYPGFKEFLGADGDELEHCMFNLTRAYIDYNDVLTLKYTSKVISNIYAKLKIKLQTEEKHIIIRDSMFWPSRLTLSDFKAHCPEYLSTCDKIHAWDQQAAEIEKLRAENAALRAEIEHLRYRPGGPGYDAVAEHFAALVTQ